VALVPTSATFILEESWNAYPHCRTVLVSGYLSVDKFRIDVETLHAPADAGGLDNALALGPAELAERKVEVLDIVDAYSGPKSEHPEWNALVYKSATGRGPLAGPGWFRSPLPAGTPLMCCYKLVRCKFNYFPIKVGRGGRREWRGGASRVHLASCACPRMPQRPLPPSLPARRDPQGTVEGKIADAQRNLFRETLCQTACTLDQWMGKTMAEIRALESEVAAKSEVVIARLRAKGEAPPVKENGYWLARGAGSPGAVAHGHSHHGHGAHHGHGHAQGAAAPAEAEAAPAVVSNGAGTM